MLVGWTGHRPDLFRDPASARAALDAAAQDLVEAEGATAFVVGGQRGVDTWAGLAAIRLKVPLHVVLPFEPGVFTADDAWTVEDRQTLERILAGAVTLRVAGSFNERNRLVATSVDLLVAVWTGARGGGTEETLNFAHVVGIPIRELRQQPSGRRAEGRGI